MPRRTGIAAIGIPPSGQNAVESITCGVVGYAPGPSVFGDPKGLRPWLRNSEGGLLLMTTYNQVKSHCQNQWSGPRWMGNEYGPAGCVRQPVGRGNTRDIVGVVPVPLGERKVSRKQGQRAERK